MSDAKSLSRRRLLKKLVLAAPLVVLAGRTRRAAADGPLLSVNDPEAKAVHYIEDSSQSTDKDHHPGSTCANCALYQGKQGSSEGGCQLFAGRDVLATGWCNSWSAEM
jgi:hypothetical protein